MLQSRQTTSASYGYRRIPASSQPRFSRTSTRYHSAVAHADGDLATTRLGLCTCAWPLSHTSGVGFCAVDSAEIASIDLDVTSDLSGDIRYAWSGSRSVSASAVGSTDHQPRIAAGSAHAWSATEPNSSQHIPNESSFHTFGRRRKYASPAPE
jgi:hypothetical protein